jgi:very-short-patch-repair endonuclease
VNCQKEEYKMQLTKKRRNLLDIQKELLEKGELINFEVTNTTSEHKFGNMIINAGIHIKPQHQVGDYFFDFKIIETSILIEIDGDVHASDEVRTKDCKKSRFAQARGFKVVRFTNTEINTDKAKDLINELQSIIKNEKIQPREVVLYPLSIWEQIKRWFKR